MKLHNFIILSALVLGSTAAQAQESSAPSSPSAQAPSTQQIQSPSQQRTPEDTDEEADIPPPPNFIGSATAGYRYSVLGDKTGYKFDEYKDMSNGPLLGAEGMFFRDDGYFGEFRLSDLAQEDRSGEYTGGKWGGIRYTVYGNTIRHNYSNFARTFYTSGVGTDNVSYQASDYGTVDGDPGNFTISRNLATWQGVEYKKTVDSVGASVLLRGNSPWSVALSTDYRMIKGVQPQGASSAIMPDFPNTGTPSKFGHAVELPAPIDGTNLMAGAEVGYHNEDYNFILSGDISRFDNKYDYLTWRDPFVTTQNLTQTLSLSPDSNSYHIAGKAIAKNLPVDSTLAVTYGFQRITSEIPLLNTIAESTNPGGTTVNYSTLTLGLSDNTFNGKIDYQKAAAVWAANPMQGLTTNVTLRWLKKDNLSEEITYTHPTVNDPATGQLAQRTNGLFSYDKNDIVLGSGYKLTNKSKVDLTLQRNAVNRHEERHDAVHTIDYRADLGYRNSSSKFVTFGAKGFYLDRNSQFDEDISGITINPTTGASTDARAITTNFRLFDVQDKTRTGVTVNADVSPLDDLSIGLQYSYANDDYRGVLLGLKQDKRDSYMVDVSYEKIGLFRVYAFYEMEKSRNNGQWRQATGSAQTNPNGPTTATSFNWTGEFNDDNTYYGATLAVPVIENKLDVQLGYTVLDNDGRADFETLGGTTAAFADNDLYTDYKKDELSATLAYRFTEKLRTSLTYAQQRLSVNDAQWNLYTPIVNANNDRALGNAMSDVSYNAQLYYATVNYEF